MPIREFPKPPRHLQILIDRSSRFHNNTVYAGLARLVFCASRPSAFVFVRANCEEHSLPEGTLHGCVQYDAIHHKSVGPLRAATKRLCGFLCAWPVPSIRSLPPLQHILVCPAFKLGARGSYSSTCWQFQSRRLCAPRCVRYPFPSRAPSPPRRPVRRHIARSRLWHLLITTFSTTRQDGGCKSHTCCYIAYVSNP